MDSQKQTLSRVNDPNNISSSRMAMLSNTDIVVCHKINTDKEVINFNSGCFSSVTL